MPRKSMDEVELTEAERAELQARARRYTAPYFQVVRAKMILFAADGMTNEQIAARLDTPRQVVARWRHRFVREGLPGLDDRPRSGRPPLSGRRP